MQRLLSTNAWDEIARLARDRPVRAAIAYVTHKHVSFRQGDVLVTDASHSAIASGQTSAVLLRQFVKAGAAVFSVSGLHAKMIVCGRKTIIGSANMSTSSTRHLIEAVALTDDPLLRSQSLAFIDRLTGLVKQLSLSEADELAKIVVIRTGRPPARVPVLVPRGGHGWIVSVNETSREPDEEEQSALQRGEKLARERLSRRSADVSWVKFSGATRFRQQATEGDNVVQLWKALGAKRRRAILPSTILLRQEEAGCTRFFVE